MKRKLIPFLVTCAVMLVAACDPKPTSDGSFDSVSSVDSIQVKGFCDRKSGLGNG